MKVCTVKGDGVVPATDWFRAYRVVVWNAVKTAEKTD